VKHGDLSKAGKLQRELTPKMEALFLYPSPAPVKAVLNAQNWSVGSPRLPILPLNQKEKLNLAHQLGVNHLADVQLHY
jgi:4-hydroxy-tetrahydrodipicolinate synthase